MDWRNRDYYLVATDPYLYEMRHGYYKIAAPSLKRHAPYNHFKDNGKFKGIRYDGLYKKITGKGYVQEMISCKKEESENLEYELRTAVRNDGGSYGFCKLNKEMCGQ